MVIQEVQFEPLTDAEPSRTSTERLTIDQVLDRTITGYGNWRVYIPMVLLSGTVISTVAQIYMTIFAGFIPYTEWECVSERCWEVLEQANNTISKGVMCDNKLIAGEDFNWTTDRTSYGIDWDLYCDDFKQSVVNSFYFIGAFLGLIFSSIIFDQFGRKYGSLIGGFLGIICALSGVFLDSFPMLLALRVGQGCFQFVLYTGCYCWLLEFSPSHLRNMCNVFGGLFSNGGYAVSILIGYLVMSWRHIFAWTTVVNLVVVVPLIFLPMSPRFFLVKGREEEAKRVLTRLSRFAGNPINLGQIELVYQKRPQNVFKQVKDFWRYPKFGMESLALFFSWFSVATLFYGFSFGWGKIITHRYLSHALASVGRLIGDIAVYPACRYFGVRKATLGFIIVAVISDLLAMPDVHFGVGWTLEHVSCLLGATCCGAVFCLIYQLTVELAPTSHRGMVLSLSSSSARIGSFIGPYMSLMYTVADRRVPLVVYAILTALLGVAVWVQPEKKGEKIPETPGDVQDSATDRRK